MMPSTPHINSVHMHTNKPYGFTPLEESIFNNIAQSLDPEIEWTNDMKGVLGEKFVSAILHMLVIINNLRNTIHIATNPYTRHKYRTRSGGRNPILTHHSQPDILIMQKITRKKRTYYKPLSQGEVKLWLSGETLTPSKHNTHVKARFRLTTKNIQKWAVTIGAYIGETVKKLAKNDSIQLITHNITQQLTNHLSNLLNKPIKPLPNTPILNSKTEHAKYMSKNKQIDTANKTYNTYSLAEEIRAFFSTPKHKRSDVKYERKAEG